MAEQGYNGWTNYETWNVALWIDNEEGSQRYWREQARDAFRHARDRGVGLDRREQAIRDLADMLKDEIEEGNPLADQASMYSDLLGAALSEVNWREIAENWMEDVDRTEEEDQ